MIVLFTVSNSHTAKISNIPAIKYSLPLIAGIIAGSMLPLNKSHITMTIFVCIVAIVFLRSKSSLIQPLLYLLIFITGFAKFNFDSFNISGSSVARLKTTLKDESVLLTGIVSDLPDHDSARIRFTLMSKFIAARETLFTEGDFLVTITKSRYDTSDLRIKPGDLLVLKGSISEPPGSRNDGEFDYRRYLFLKGIYKTFRVYGFSNVTLQSQENLDFVMQKIIYPSKIFSINCVERQSRGDEAEFLKGLVVGDRSDISDEVKRDFMDAGVSHLIAVSGLNVAYLILSLSLLLSVFRLNNTFKLIVILIFLIYYCMLTGNTASIVRASIMGGLALVSFRMQRKSQFYNIVGVSACLILLYDSRLLFDAGFILSFAATVSMVWIYEKLDKHFVSGIFENENRTARILRNILAAFLITFAAQAGTLPITASYFGKISLISLIVNIVAVPLANLSLAIGFMQISFSLISESVASLAAETNNLLLSVQLFIIRQSASIPGSSFYIEELTGLQIAGIYFCILLVVTSANLKAFLLRLFISVIMVTTLKSDFYSKKNELSVTMLDAGQGDCIVIQTPDDKNIVVDCGNSTNSFDIGEKTLAPFLRRKGVSEIDLLILTHNHADHIGGAAYIIENFRVRTLVYSSNGIKQPMASGIFEKASSKNVKMHEAEAGDFIDGAGEVRIYLLFPELNQNAVFSGEMQDNLNNSSVVFLLKYKEAEILFTGDIEAEAEKYLVEKYGTFLSSDVLKSAHHGSKTSSTSEFLSIVVPEAVTISCGINNKFGHPSSEVLKRYRHTGAEIYRTDLNGGITIVTDGSTFNIKESYYR